MGFVLVFGFFFLFFFFVCFSLAYHLFIVCLQLNVSTNWCAGCRIMNFIQELLRYRSFNIVTVGKVGLHCAPTNVNEYFFASEFRSGYHPWLWQIAPNLNLSHTATVCISFSGCPSSGIQRLICRWHREDDLCSEYSHSCHLDAATAPQAQPSGRTHPSFHPKCRHINAGVKRRAYLVIALCLQQSSSSPVKKKT